MRKVLGLVALMMATPGVAQIIDTTNPGAVRAQLLPTPSPAGIAAVDSYRYRLTSLHDTALRTQAIDGGTLTPEHRVELQADLDRINARFREKVRRLDPLSANADGTSINARP